MRVISTDIIRQTVVQHCRTYDLELTATCCVKLRLSLSLSLLSNPDLKVVCFLLLSANYSTSVFRQRLCSRLTALWRYINFVLLLLLLLHSCTFKDFPFLVAIYCNKVWKPSKIVAYNSGYIYNRYDHRVLKNFTTLVKIAPDQRILSHEQKVVL